MPRAFGNRSCRQAVGLLAALLAFAWQPHCQAEPVSGAARQRVLVNHATGINPKPWRDGRFLNLSKNEEGAPLLSGSAALLEPAGAEVREAVLGARLFTNCGYTLNALPDVLRGKRFLLAPMEGAKAVCRQPGMVYVATPVPARNGDSVAETLIARGFVKVRVPELILFLTHDGYAASSNACTLYQKQVQAGETLEWGKWGLVLF